MTSEPNKTDKLPGTVVIADFAERRAHAIAREEVPDKETMVPGAKIDRYLIIERLGGGGMGVVYKAHDTELDRVVALKILPPHLCRNQEYLNRFRAEAQAHARLNSPYVITLFSLLELPAGEVLALEYVEGQSLEQRLRISGPLEAAEAARIFDQALRAVENVHSCNVVHRDLKPGNIYLTKDGRVKLMDFGVAKLMDQPEHNAQRTMVGTLLYISPEQINGHTTDFRSDVYTMGVSLFETVTGRLPFERRSDYALMHAHVQERPPSPKTFEQSIPKALEAVIMKSIEKDPNRRFQSAAEFRNALLRTGLVERRSRGRSGEPDFIIETIGKMSRRRGPKILGSMWFEGALIAAVVALLYMLDIIPLHYGGNEQTATPAVTTVAPAGASSTSVPSKPTRAPAEKAPAKYDSLRDAWSN
ncbi:MAG TPA: serine/threonine-protein kinase [Burkholderiales bacterium]|nr:serine/threonine-protein kinase [Burkholderiales bacterium]